MTLSSQLFFDLLGLSDRLVLLVLADVDLGSNIVQLVLLLLLFILALVGELAHLFV